MLGRRPTGLNFESRVWRAVSPYRYHNPQEVLLAQFSLYVHKCDIKPHTFIFITFDTANLHLTRRWPDNITVTFQQRPWRKPSLVFIFGLICCVYFDSRNLHYIKGCSRSALRLHVIIMD